MNSDRVGRFYVHSKQVTDNIVDIADMLARMKFVPLRVQLLAYANQFEYIGISHLFEDTDMGLEIPEYVMECSRDQNGHIISVHGNRV